QACAVILPRCTTLQVHNGDPVSARCTTHGQPTDGDTPRAWRMVGRIKVDVENRLNTGFSTTLSHPPRRSIARMVCSGVHTSMVSGTASPWLAAHSTNIALLCRRRSCSRGGQNNGSSERPLAAQNTSSQVGTTRSMPCRSTISAIARRKADVCCRGLGTLCSRCTAIDQPVTEPRMLSARCTSQPPLCSSRARSNVAGARPPVSKTLGTSNTPKFASQPPFQCLGEQREVGEHRQRGIQERVDRQVTERLVYEGSVDAARVVHPKLHVRELVRGHVAVLRGWLSKYAIWSPAS
ncbi:MAG: hypothetical protein ACI9MC_004181, partial [Kiritimatiellia bacterium]